MSFALTTPQVRAQTKTVTRRIGWTFARPGDLVQPIVKGQGLKKGQTVERIGHPIRVVSVRREPLHAITDDDVVREGFPQLSAREFAGMFMDHNACLFDQLVTRIEFVYLPAHAFLDPALTAISLSALGRSR
jgi:hypothetical protein